MAMIKLTKRKYFKFYRSYFDVFNELSDRNKVQFVQALLEKQFMGVEPTGLKGSAKLAWIGQMNSIDEQVKGYEAKAGALSKNTPSQAPTQGPSQGATQGGAQGPSQDPSLQEKEKGKGKGKGKEGKTPNLIYPFDSEKFKKHWQLWKSYKKEEHRFNFHSATSEQAGLKKLNELADGQEEISIAIIEQSLANGWKGLFKLQTDKNGTDKFSEEAIKARLERW